MGKSPHDVWGSTFDPKPIPDHKPWEKVCPECDGSGEDGEGGMYPVNGVWKPMACWLCVPDGENGYGTGCVPMTTTEMLEALAAEAGHVTHSVHLSFNPMRSLESGQWMASVYYGSRRSSVERYGTTPDDALRAALEAVG